METHEAIEYHHHHPHCRHPEEEEEEDSLSLRDLPLGQNHNDFPKTATSQTPPRRSSSSDRPATDDDNHFFEFLCSDNYNMISAEDIIFRGKLVPFKQLSNEDEEENTKRTVFRRRSESLSGLRSSTTTRSDSSRISTNKILLRNSRSLDYQKLRRFPSSNIDRNSSVRSTGKSDKKSVTGGGKPRWYFFMFGMVKFPSPEMELRDIKSRQLRRNSSLIFPSSDSASDKGSSTTSWRFLKALSCKDHTSVAATVPYCVSHA